ncbi:MAG: hypothetical protein EOO77_08055 [Oxalobacteraceae bacterium]|nr:MAG: hypothetical protein EOO77_08055 [Oxalobacteraceae bacterium]
MASFDFWTQLGFDATLCGQVLALFICTIQRRYRHRAKAHLGLASVRQTHTCAVTAIQRFSVSLGLNLYFHSFFVDGVFLEGADGQAQFRAQPPPSRRELQAVSEKVCAAVHQAAGKQANQYQVMQVRKALDVKSAKSACFCVVRHLQLA